MYESRISAGATEKLPGWEKPHAKKTAAWSYDMEQHAQKCVERYCDLANKKDRAAIQSLKVLPWMINISRTRNLNRLESCQKYARKLS